MCSGNLSSYCVTGKYHITVSALNREIKELYAISATNKNVMWHNTVTSYELIELCLLL